MARAAYDNLRKLGLTHQQVMNRMADENPTAFAETQRADARQAAGDFSGGNTFSISGVPAPTDTTASARAGRTSATNSRRDLTTRSGIAPPTRPRTAAITPPLRPRTSNEPPARPDGLRPSASGGKGLRTQVAPQRPRAEQADFIKADAFESMQFAQRQKAIAEGRYGVQAADPVRQGFGERFREDLREAGDFLKSTGGILPGLPETILKAEEAIGGFVTGKDQSPRDPFPGRGTRKRQHVVEKGDDYRSLAKKARVHELDLIRANKGQELRPGLVIDIPSALSVGEFISDRVGGAIQDFTGQFRPDGGIEFGDAQTIRSRPEQADFIAADAKMSDQDRVDRVKSLRPGQESQEDLDFFGRLFDVGTQAAGAMLRAMQGTVGAASDIIWKAGADKDNPVEGVDYVVRTVPIEDMPGGQGSGRLAWAESRLPEGTKLEDWDAQTLLDQGMFTESEIWWMIGQGLIVPPKGSGGDTGITVGPGGGKRIANVTKGGGGGTSRAGTQYSQAGSRPQGFRNNAILETTSWSI